MTRTFAAALLALCTIAPAVQAADLTGDWVCESAPDMPDKYAELSLGEDGKGRFQIISVSDAPGMLTVELMVTNTFEWLPHDTVIRMLLPTFRTEVLDASGAMLERGDRKQIIAGVREALTIEHNRLIRGGIDYVLDSDGTLNLYDNDDRHVLTCLR